MLQIRKCETKFGWEDSLLSRKTRKNLPLVRVLETLTLLCDEIHLIGDGLLIRSFSNNEFSNIHDFLFKSKNHHIVENINELLN